MSGSIYYIFKHSILYIYTCTFFIERSRDFHKSEDALQNLNLCTLGPYQDAHDAHVRVPCNYIFIYIERVLKCGEALHSSRKDILNWAGCRGRLLTFFACLP